LSVVLVPHEGVSFHLRSRYYVSWSFHSTLLALWKWWKRLI
jgi:hypothetical protein